MSRSYRGVASVALAVLLFTPALALAASDPHFKAGYDLFKQRNYAGAAAELTQSSEMQGTDYNFFLLLANTYIQLRQWDKAIEPAKKAAGIDPAKKEPHVLLGTAQMRSENFSQAAAAFAAAVKIVPGDFQLNSSLGYSYYRAGDNQNAIAALEKAIAIKANDYTTVYTLGTAYVKEKQCAKAEPFLDKARALQPKQDDAIRGMLMGCYSSSGDSKKAIEQAKEAVTKNPKDGASLTFLAQSAMAAKNWDEAMDWYGKLAAVKPKSGDPHFQMAQIQMVKKDFPAAITTYEKALSLENKCEWRAALGALYQTQGIEIDNAVGEALQVDPAAEPDSDKLTEMRGHYAKAKAEFQKAVKACKSADAKKGIAAIDERVGAWKAYEKESEEGVPPGDAEGEESQEEAKPE